MPGYASRCCSPGVGARSSSDIDDRGCLVVKIWQRNLGSRPRWRACVTGYVPDISGISFQSKSLLIQARWTGIGDRNHVARNGLVQTRQVTGRTLCGRLHGGAPTSGRFGQDSVQIRGPLCKRQSTVLPSRFLTTLARWQSFSVSLTDRVSSRPWLIAGRTYVSPSTRGSRGQEHTW